MDKKVVGEVLDNDSVFIRKHRFTLEGMFIRKFLVKAVEIDLFNQNAKIGNFGYDPLSTNVKVVFYDVCDSNTTDKIKSTHQMIKLLQEHGEAEATLNLIDGVGTIMHQYKIFDMQVTNIESMYYDYEKHEVATITVYFNAEDIKEQ